MANRSVYNEGVEVHQRHLQNTEAQRAAGDNQILSDITSRGVMSGLGVTVGGTNTRISIDAGTAYAPNGEYMSLAAGQTNVQLASDTLGVINYVLLVYDETYSSTESHETDGTTLNTKATVSPRIAVLTATAYNALTASDPVLSNNDRNRSVVLARVTANGPAVPLTIGSIELPSLQPAALTSGQPVNITGITIISVDSQTAPGTGTLTYAFGAQTLTWAAPGDSAGATVPLLTSTTYIITSTNGRTILVRVSFSTLPGSNKSDSILITNIYAQNIVRQTALDAQHRSMLGTGEPTPHNPHGMTLADLAPGQQTAVEEHQDVMHHNGLARFNNVNTLKLIVNTAPAPDTLSVTNFTAGDYAYVNGFKITTLVSSPTVVFDAPEGTQVSTWGIYLNQDGTILKTKRTSFAGTVLFDKLQIVNMSDGMPAGSTTITWTNTGLIDAGGQTIAAPTVDSVVRLDIGDSVNWLDCYVKGGATPGGTQTDTVTRSIEPVVEENILLGYVQWSGSASGFLGYGFGIASAGNLTIDRRPFGTLGSAEMADEAGYTSPSDIAHVLFGDGIAPHTQGVDYSPVGQLSAQTAVVNQFKLSTVTTGNATLTGGIAYIDGKELKMPATTFAGISAGGTTRFWIDHTGAYQATINSWDGIIGSQAGQSIIRIADVITNGSATETSRVDRRVYVGAKHDVEGGVLGLDRDRRAVVTTQPATAVGGSALTVQALGTNVNGVTAIVFGTGIGLTAFGGGTGGNAIKGQGLFTGSVGGEFIGGPGGNAVIATGNASGSGAFVLGGTTDGSAGLTATSLATNGNGARIDGTGTGYGVQIQSGTGAIGDAAIIRAVSTNGNGAKCIGTGTGAGVWAQGATTAQMVAKVDGWADFNGATNPAPNSAVVAGNTITPMNICKAWGEIVCGSAIPVLAGINDGFNIDTASCIFLDPNTARIVFKNPMAAASYSVNVQAKYHGAVFIAVPLGTSSTSFDFIVYDTSFNLKLIDVTGTNYHVYFQVFARQ